MPLQICSTQVRCTLGHLGSGNGLDFGDRSLRANPRLRLQVTPPFFQLIHRDLFHPVPVSILGRFRSELGTSGRDASVRGGFCRVTCAWGGRIELTITGLPPSELETEVQPTIAQCDLEPHESRNDRDH